MRHILRFTSVCVVILLISLSVSAQQAGTRPTGRDLTANRLITIDGTLKDSNGLPRLGNVGITFSLYASQEGETPLWQESQSVQTDEQGRYTAFLGATEKEGLPIEVFSNGEAKWLGVRVQGEEEQPRVLLVAVPYALKAADADTVGGKPLTSFVLYEDLAKIIEKQVTPAMIVAQNAARAPGFVAKQGASAAGSGFTAERNLAISGNSGPPRVGAYETNSNTGYGLSTAAQTIGSNNSYFGYSAGSTTTSPAAYNSVFGSWAGYSNGTASDNSYFGFDAGYYNTGSDNAMFGYCAGCWGTTGSYNSFFGAGAAQFLGTGANNSIFGQQAGYNIGAGTNNALFGRQAGYSNTANENSFFGTEAGYSNTSGTGNAFFGFQSGRTNQVGASNSFFGYNAGYSNSSGNYNSFLGYQAGSANTIGGSNSFFGYHAGNANVDGTENSFFGSEAGLSNTSADGNSFFGRSAGRSNTTGSPNAFFGYRAGYSNQTGNVNAYFGSYAGQLSTGSGNAFFGDSAGYANTSGFWNTFLGGGVGINNNTGYYNTFAGTTSGFNNTSGSRNTFVGYQAGYNSTSGSNTVENNNTFIGASTLGDAGITNATVIGYQARVTQSNSLVLGSINGVNGAIADTKVGIGTTAPVSHLNVLSTSTTSPRGVANEQYNNGMDGVQFRGRKARGTPAAPAAIQSGDVLGNYVFDGHDGSAFGTGVQIRPVAEENWNPTAHGAYLALWTTPPGTITNTEKMRITGSGYVGIGTTTPTERLHVIGNLRISGAYLQGAPEEPVPDYVFEPDYKLMPIEDLQRYVQKEKHLPNVPNAGEIKDKGLNLGEFQMKLLQKIEELTLYTAQQAKTNHDQQTALREKDSQISALKLQNATLDARLSSLEQVIGQLLKQPRGTKP